MKLRSPVILTAAIAAVLFLMARPGAIGPSQEAGDLPARIARVESGLLPPIVISGEPARKMRLADRMAALNVPGVSVAVINDGAIEWARGYGVLEAGSVAPVGPHTRFQAASISKSIATLAALRLVEQGVLALDEDVNTRLKSWKIPRNALTERAPVTLRRLLNHSAGLTVHGFPGYAADRPVPSLVQILDGEKPANTVAVRVDVEPGTIWRYSGGGFTVMQQLLIDVTGKTFPRLVAELVLQPLAMADSTCEQPLPAGLRLVAASGHRSKGSILPGKYHTYPEMAAAGLWTTPSDLAKFAIEIQKGLKGQSRVVSRAIAEQMATIGKGAYGLGLQITREGTVVRFGHGGSNEGFKCQFLAYADPPQGVAVMTNGDRGSALDGEIIRALAAEYGWTELRPREKTVVSLPAETLAAYAGRYQMTPTRLLRVVVEGQRLVVEEGSARRVLLPEAETRFFDASEGTGVEFVRAAGGSVSHMVISGSVQAKRIEGT
jgi:CubicO group peptidase (beta-lactamase class C family)